MVIGKFRVENGKFRVENGKISGGETFFGGGGKCLKRSSEIWRTGKCYLTKKLWLPESATVCT